MSSRHFLLVLVATWLFVAPQATAQNSAPPDWRFGVVEAYEAPAAADELGVAWSRITFNWAEVQAEGADSWMPPVDEAQLEAEIAAGRMPVGLLIGTPQWARDEDGLPRGLWLPDDDPDNLWARYVERTVGQYQGRIDHWIIWNEPDIWDEAAPGHTWNGSVQDFAQLQKVAYRQAKERNPASIIHLAAFTYYWDANYDREQYLSRLLDALADDPLAANYHYYFDVGTAHLYFQPAYVYDVLQTFRQILAQHGLHKPFWLIETNAPPSNDPTWPVSDVTLRVSLDEQAAYMPQAVALALAAGVERIAVYKLKDTDGDLAANPEPFGLVRRDGSRRPAFATYRLATQYMAGVLHADRERWDAVAQIRLQQEDFNTTVLFARLPQVQEVAVPATSREAVLADMWGNQQRVTARDGHFELTLPGASCTQSIGDYCMIGGTVFYLIQAREGRSLPDSLPAAGQSPTEQPPPTILPTPAPTGTSTPTRTRLPTATAAPTETSAPATDGQSPIATTWEPSAAVSSFQEIAVVSNQVTVDFPASATFRLELPPESGVTAATLTFGVAKRSCVEVGTEVPVSVENTVAEWTWVMSRSGNPPPGTELWWQWQVADGAGNVTTTPRQTATLNDERFEWQTVQAERIHLHWYRGDEVGPLLLEAAVEGLERLEQEMGIQLQQDVNFYIYGDAADMRQAVLYIQDWAGGVAFTEYNTILIGVRPDIAQDWGRETVRHELAHLVLGQFGWSCLGGSRPTWLEEGLAVYAQGAADAETLQDMSEGIEENAFVPLRSLKGSFPAHGREAGLAYSQSYSVVNFLLEEYGAERLQELILTLAQGIEDDTALQQVYGFNVDGLEVAWREAIGAPARTIPPTPTPIRAAAVATVAPLSGVESQPTPAATAAAAQPEPSASPVCGLAFVPLLLITAVGLLFARFPDQKVRSK